MSVALNLAGLVAISAAAAQWPMSGGLSGPPQRVMTVFVVPPAPAVAIPDSMPTAAIGPDRREETKSAHRPTAPPPLALPSPAPAVGTSDVPNAVRYYRIGEVDRPAVPESDWNLDTAALDSAGLSRMVFEVFVSREGLVVGCTILEPARLADEIRTRLEDRLKQSVLQPARRDGEAVASVRKIEIEVLPATE